MFCKLGQHTLSNTVVNIKNSYLSRNVGLENGSYPSSKEWVFDRMLKEKLALVNFIEQWYDTVPSGQFRGFSQVILIS